MVKCIFLAQFPVDHLAHPIVSSHIVFWANLHHSLIMWFIVSSLSPHNLHLLFCSVLSILALILLVLMAFCAGTRRDSVSLLTQFNFSRLRFRLLVIWSVNTIVFLPVLLFCLFLFCWWLCYYYYNYFILFIHLLVINYILFSRLFFSLNSLFCETGSVWNRWRWDWPVMAEIPNHVK